MKGVSQRLAARINGPDHEIRHEATVQGKSRPSTKRKEKIGETYINKHVLPQAPSPTMTSLRRISAMAARVQDLGGVVSEVLICYLSMVCSRGTDRINRFKAAAALDV